MKNLLFLLCLCLSGVAFGQQYEHAISDPQGEPREHELDITHMKVDVRFDPAKGLVQGLVNHTFTPLRKSVKSVFWTAPGIDIKEATLLGANMPKVSTRITPEGVVTEFDAALTWDVSYTLEIKYEATPSKGIYFIGWNSPKVTDPKYQTRQQIWTQGQGIDNRHWIPMYDNQNDKFITETVVTFSSEFKVLSNGEKLKEKKNILR